MFKKTILAIALAATTMSSTAAAHDGRRWNNPYNDHNSGASTAVVAGVIGLALGLAIANSHNEPRYEDREYHRDPRDWDYMRRNDERDLIRNGYYFYHGYYYGPEGYIYQDRFYRDYGRGYRYYYRYREGY